MAITEMEVKEIAEKINNKELSSLEVAEAFLKRIDTVDAGINAYITVAHSQARKAAGEIDDRIASGESVGEYAGVPVGVKDVLCTEGLRTTCGSRILSGFSPVYDATVVKKIREAGLVILGKANMDEFAMGSSTENSYFGPTRNPWDPERVPGGSSGGSAALVAAGEAPWALGSDTGGSIRQPAAMCGIVGMKPTYGLVSRYGLVAFASSLDQVGPMTRNVHDCAVLLDMIAGHDPLDSTSIPGARPCYADSLNPNVRGLKVGVVRELTSTGIEPGVLREFNKAVELLAASGLECEEVSLSSFEYGLSAYYLIAPAEASSNLARFDGVRYGFRAEGEMEDIWEMYDRTRSEGFGDEVKRRIMLGTYALSAGYYDEYYAKALKVRTLIVEDFNRAWGKFDVLVSPTSPTTAFKIGEKVDDPLTMYLSDICTIPVNLAGIPAISIPCGLSGGLPVGFQIMAPPLQEEKLLSVACGLESLLGFDEKPPALI
ncbi:MAG: Asp-tRNA(Asn)/Glu-tRNA(Gln) amidotransferase subunit GatA [Actinobacteria bacterium]|nr:Asp-tRNA(Asn)/Glu-tRNA(Gln) amidotransferase subunit GatA [Actinomycetota bacterium]